jgi:hypothetical protein
MVSVAVLRNMKRERLGGVCLSLSPVLLPTSSSQRNYLLEPILLNMTPVARESQSTSQLPPRNDHPPSTLSVPESSADTGSARLHLQPKLGMRILPRSDMEHIFALFFTVPLDRVMYWKLYGNKSANNFFSLHLLRLVVDQRSQQIWVPCMNLAT